MIHTQSDFLLNPKMVALAIDFSVSSIIHSWGTVSGAGGFAEPATDICTRVWIKLLSLTGKHSKLSFIFLKNKQTEEALFMHPVCFYFLVLGFMDARIQNLQIPKPTSHEHVPAHTPVTAICSNTLQYTLYCLKECSCHSQALMAFLEVVTLHELDTFSLISDNRDGQNISMCSEEFQGRTTCVHFDR